jgi:hypothetical protein
MNAYYRLFVSIVLGSTLGLGACSQQESDAAGASEGIEANQSANQTAIPADVEGWCTTNSNDALSPYNNLDDSEFECGGNEAKFRATMKKLCLDAYVNFPTCFDLYQKDQNCILAETEKSIRYVCKAGENNDETFPALNEDAMGICDKTYKPLTDCRDGVERANNKK